MTTTQEEQKKRQWPLKLLALVCAILLWFYAEAEKNPLLDVQFDVPVQYINQQEDYAVENEIKMVRVTVKGKEVELSGLRSDDFQAVVDLSQAEIGVGDYDIEVTGPGTVERISYQPLRATLQIDEIQTKEIPIRVRTTGTLPEGVSLIRTEIFPDNVMVKGRSQILETLSDLETEAIDVSNLTKETTIAARLNMPNEITVAEGKSTVSVHFVVQSEGAKTSAEITLRNVPDGLNAVLDSTSAEVFVNDSGEFLNRLQELKKIQLYVDCTGLGVGEHTLPVQVEYDGGLTIQQIMPDHVDVLITEKSDSSVNGESQETEKETEQEGEVH